MNHSPCELIAPLLVKKFAVFYGTRKFITVLNTDRNRILFL